MGRRANTPMGTKDVFCSNVLTVFSCLVVCPCSFFDGFPCCGGRRRRRRANCWTIARATLSPIDDRKTTTPWVVVCFLCPLFLRRSAGGCGGGGGSGGGGAVHESCGRG